MTRFLSIGECMVEMSPQADGNFALGFAGDTFNSAWYAKQLAPEGVDVAYMTAVGDDTPSQEMLAFMRKAGIETEVEVRPGGHVGLYMISLQDGERSFSYWRDSSAARSLADNLTTLPNSSAGDMVLFSGITMAILPDAGRNNLLATLDKARQNGVTIAFDPNLRPRLWTSEEEMCHWITKAAEVADIALPSFEDEAAFFNDTDKHATAQRYADAGATTVITKDGAAPVLILNDGQETMVSPEKVIKLVDTTAAGDSFNAGYLMAKLAGLSDDASVTQGCKTSAQVVQARGALISIKS